jgi:dTDP-4-dehydrorhamnose reductase
MLLVTGGSGKLGRALRGVFPHAVAPSRREFDLLDAAAVERFVAERRPRMVVHAAAYTSVQGAEDEKPLCWKTNVGGTERLVEAIQAAGVECYFVYVSTACVFFGDRGDYTEEDVPHPKNFYGLTKLVGEYVARRLPCHLVVRTNFAAREPWPYTRAFVDRFGTYLYADQVAEAIRDATVSRLTGTVHIAGDRRLSMLEMARLTSPAVEPMSVREMSLPLTMDMTLRSVRIGAYRLTTERVA